jgi:hypothetical protein
LPALFLAMGLVLNGGWSISVHASTVDKDGVFELDGNACANTSTGTDWSSLFAANSNCLSTTGGGTGFNGVQGSPGASTFINEPPGIDNTYLTGGSSKDPSDFNNWLLQTNCAGSPPNVTICGVQAKDEIDQAFAALYKGKSGTTAGHNLMVFGDDRLSNGGDAFTGFWITQKPVGYNGQNGFSCSTPICGQHTVGDLLISSNFTQGGSTDDVRVYQWNPAAADGPLHLLQDTTGKCGDGSNLPYCEITNSGGQAAPWTYQFKSSGNANITTPSTFPSEAFFEGGIDLTQFAGNACFSTFIAETRSSQSFTSTLSDVAIHSFPTCGASVSIDAGNTNPVGIPHTFTINANQTVQGTSGPADSASLTATINSTNSTAKPAAIYLGTSVPTGVDCAHFPTSPPQSATGSTTAGVMKVTVLSCTPGTVYVDVSGTVTPNGGGSIPVSTTAQQGTTACPTNCGVKTYADGYVTITPQTATNAAGFVHTLTVTAYKTTTGTYSLAGGVGIVLTLLSNNNGASFVGGVNTCTTASSGTALGTCTVQISTSTTGTVNIQAQATFDSTVIPGLSQSFTRTTGTTDNSNNSGNASKQYVDGRLFITPHAPQNSVGQPETFTIQVQTSTSSTAGTDNWTAAPQGVRVDYSIIANADSSATPSDATFVANTTTGPTCPSGSATTSGSTTTNASGQVQVTVLSCKAGEITVHGKAYFDGTVFTGLPAAQNFTRETSGSTNTALGDSTACSTDSTSSGSNCFNDAIKTYHAGEIKITKSVQLGPVTAQPVICFTLTQTNSSGTSLGGQLILNGAQVTNPNEICAGPSPNVTGATNVNFDWSTGNYTYDWKGLGAGYYVVNEVSASFPYSLNTLYSGTVQDLTGLATHDVATVDLGTASNPLPPGSLQIVKQVNGGAVPSGATFKFNVYHCSDSGSTAGVPGTCAGITPSTDPTGVSPAGSVASLVVTMTGGSPASCALTNGNGQAVTNACTVVSNDSGGLKVQINKLAEGWYLTYEQSLPAGSPYSIDPNRSQTLLVLSGNDQPASTGNTHTPPLATYNNQKLYRIVVVTCDMNGNLVQTSVQINPLTGQSQNTLAAPASGSFTVNDPNSATQYNVCLLGTQGTSTGANFTGVNSNGNGLAPGSYSLNVNNLGS